MEALDSTVPHLSIVSTLYCSSEFIDEFVARCIHAAQQVGHAFEIVLVDDGSPDDSLSRALDHARRDHRIRVIELARNFGHHAAILTGLSYARGEFIFLVDSDLEEDPALLLEFLQKLETQKADVVFGVHAQSAGSFFRRTTSKIFWKFFNTLSESTSPENICNVRIMTRAYVAALLTLPERNLFLGGLFMWPGFRQIPVAIDRRINRKYSTYTLLKRVQLSIKSIVAFSSRPLFLISGLGIFIATTSGMIGLYFIILKLIYPGTILSGFTAIIVSIWFLGGLILGAVGLLGIYLAYVYIETKARPRTIVKQVHTFPSTKA